MVSSPNGSTLLMLGLGIRVLRALLRRGVTTRVVNAFILKHCQLRIIGDEREEISCQYLLLISLNFGLRKDAL